MKSRQPQGIMSCLMAVQSGLHAIVGVRVVESRSDLDRGEPRQQSVARRSAQADGARTRGAKVAHAATSTAQSNGSNCSFMPVSRGDGIRKWERTKPTPPRTVWLVHACHSEFRTGCTDRKSRRFVKLDLAQRKYMLGKRAWACR